jgi:Flp pilus assembly protein TadB
MFQLNDLFSLLNSSHFHMALVIFVVVLIIGVIFSNVLNKRKSNKHIRRIERHRNFSEDSVFEEFKEKNKYSDYFNKYVQPYIRKNPNKFYDFLKKIGISLEVIQRQLLRADVKNITPEEIGVMKIIGLFGAIFVLVTTFLFLGIYSLLISLSILVFFYVMPTARIERIYKKRKEIMKDTLPMYLRLLADATSAGLTIEESIKKINKKTPGLLSEEFLKVENEAKYSNDWGQALENMAFKNDVDELYNLIAEIKITKEKGTPITDVLLRHAEKIELESVLNITEKARKKATTLIFPIFLFLFAPLLVLILLPAVDTLMTTF